MTVDGFERLPDDELKRYSRQILLEPIGIEGQKALKKARVLVVGAGGLGSPALIYLAAAGVGTLGIIDGDRVETWNLHRQILHFDADVGRKKTRSAAEHLEKINPSAHIAEHDTYISSDNALDILNNYDVVVNGCDNFPTRYLLSDACVLSGKPLVDAGVLQFMGQATVFLPGRGCYRCLFPVPPPPESVPGCSAAGVIGALPGHMGTLQALETIKIITGSGETLANRMVLFDALSCTYDSFEWQRDPKCPICGEEPEITELIDYVQFCGVAGPSEDDDATSPPDFSTRRTRWEVTPERVQEWMEEGRCRLVDVREPAERDVMHISRSRLVPLSRLKSNPESAAERVGATDEKPVVFYCQVGERSATATHLMDDSGHENCYSLRGGILGWLNAGFDVTRNRGDDNG